MSISLLIVLQRILRVSSLLNISTGNTFFPNESCPCFAYSLYSFKALTKLSAFNPRDWAKATALG